MKLSIIIVNYRSAKYIADAISSALVFESSATFEWIVVDNDSQDDSKEILCMRFPFIKWIDMGYNAGFSRANNEGIRQSSGETVLLLNPDTIILDDAISRCFHLFSNSQHVGCGVQLLFTDGSPQISGNFFMKGGLNHLLPLPYWGGLLKRVATFLKTKKPNILVAGQEEPVEWINGAYLMIKKEAIKVAGLMDEDFFLYAEEIEWCSRLAKVGTLCIYGNIKMIHIQGESINSATKTIDKGYTNLYDKKGMQLIVSNHLRIRKQYGKGWFLFQLINFTFAVPVFFIASFLDNVFHFRNPLNDWKRAAGLASNVAMVWKLSPIILRNKRHFYKCL